MPVAAVLHHLRHPFVGLVAAPLRAAGLSLDERDLRAGDPLPDLDAVDAIVTLGGEQSVREIDSHAELQAEVELLRRASERGVPVLGVCLGGQLLAHAHGATVSKAGRRAVAWRELAPLPAAAGDPVFSRLQAPVPALHWNEDVFDLPAGAVELLERRADGVEAFRAGACAWGVQFHPDVDRAALDRWYGDFAPWLAEVGTTEADARAADERHWAAHERLADELFGTFGRYAAASSGSQQPRVG